MPDPQSKPGAPKASAPVDKPEESQPGAKPEFGAHAGHPSLASGGLAGGGVSQPRPVDAVSSEEEDDDELEFDVEADKEAFLAAQRGEKALRGADGSHDPVAHEAHQRAQHRERKQRERADKKGKSDSEEDRKAREEAMDARIGMSVHPDATSAHFDDGSAYDVEEGKIKGRRKGDN